VDIPKDKAVEDPYAFEFGTSITAAAPWPTPQSKWLAQRNMSIETAQELNDALLGTTDDALLSPEDVASIGGSGSLLEGTVLYI
jgi:hypothetical protein